MAQVAGRAGRKNKQGLVILQTKSPDLPVIHQVIHNDYEQLYYDQLAERQMFKYPPYYRLIYVYLKHRINAQDEGAVLVLGHLKNGRIKCLYETYRSSTDSRSMWGASSSIDHI